MIVSRGSYIQVGATVSYITSNAMKYGSSSYCLQSQGKDYLAISVAVVERNDSVADKVSTAATDQQKLQTTINLAVNTTIYSHVRV